MISELLRKAAAAAAALITLTSCGHMVVLMEPETGTHGTAVSVDDDPQGETSTSAAEPTTEQFTVDVKMPEGYDIPRKYSISDFKAVLQKPELPTGCEVTALCEVLNYLGFDIDKVTLSDEFMPMDNNGITTMKTAYIGDPKSDEGFGCNAPVIVQTADDYFESVDSPCYAVDMTGSSMKELYYQVSQGRPVVIWNTINMIVSAPNLRWVTNENEEMWFNDFQHCVALYGYDLDRNVVCVADPLAGNVEYDLKRFESIFYDLMGRQAVVICGDAKTEGKYKAPADKPQSPILSRNKAERKKAEEEEARRKAEEEERKKAEEERKKAEEERKKAEEEERRRIEEEEKRRAEEEAAAAPEEPEPPREEEPEEAAEEQG